MNKELKELIGKEYSYGEFAYKLTQLGYEDITDISVIDEILESGTVIACVVDDWDNFITIDFEVTILAKSNGKSLCASYIKILDIV